MTHDRPYRSRRSARQAMREIAACSGTQFSPQVVEALVRLYKRNSLPQRTDQHRISRPPHDLVGRGGAEKVLTALHEVAANPVREEPVEACIT